MIHDQLDTLWKLVPGDPLPGGSAAHCRVLGERQFRSAFEVDDCAALSAGLACLAARATFPYGQADPLELHRAHLAAAFAGQVKIDGKAPALWADLSGYYGTADGRQVQLHCNFPHHAEGVVSYLGLKGRAGTLPPRSALEEAILGRSSFELERALVGRGMIAAVLREIDEWNAHPHALATAGLPLISIERIGEGPARAIRNRSEATGGAFQGRRVLDCSRVLAGPVAGRTLAAHGADVLRIGAANLPVVEPCLVLTGFGKRNAHVDLNEPAGRETFETLLRQADIWIDAFRPGSFKNRGFDAHRAAELNPGLIVIQISAFDWAGPWAGRRGYDSIVQSSTGIVLEGSRRAQRNTPAPLPVQALDFATGYLAAFAALRLAQHQSQVGGSWRARLSLLRTRNWLLSLRGPHPFSPAQLVPDPRFLQTTRTPFGQLTAPKPLAGQWTLPPQPMGSSAAAWG